MKRVVHLAWLSYLVGIGLAFPPIAAPQLANAGPPQEAQVIEGAGVRFNRIGNLAEMPHSTVSPYVQDDQGFIWFGSHYGLNRFDGYKIKKFLPDPNDKDSLSGVYIHTLFKDRSGAIWVAADNFLDRFEPATETFRHFLIGSQGLNGEPSPVAHISQDRAGFLWLATTKGLYRLDPATGAEIRYLHDPKDPGSLSSSDIKASLEDRQGTFWIATSEGIDQFDRTTGKVTLHLPLHEEHEIYLHEDRLGVFWVTHVSGSGLAILDRKAETLIPISLRQGHSTFKGLDGLGPVFEDREGTVWVESLNTGVFKYDRDHRSFVHIRMDPSDPSGFTEYRVNHLFEDRDGTIWGSLGDLGPSLFTRSTLQFQSIPPFLSHARSVRHVLIDSLFTDDRGALWVGSDEGIRRYTRQDGQLVALPVTAPALRKLTHILAIAQDRSGDLWFGTSHDGLTRFRSGDGSSKTYRHQATDPGSLSDNNINGLFVDHVGRLWVSTWNGLNRFDPTTDTFAQYMPQPGLPVPVFWKMAEDSRGSIWIGTGYSGAYLLDPATSRFTSFTQSAPGQNGLSNDRVNSVFIDHTNSVWLATQNGLDLLDPKTGIVKSYFERDGLGGNAVSCILEDDRGMLWMGTNNGISRLDRARRSFKNYYTADGLPGNDMTGWSTCTRSAGGDFTFGGFSGGVTFRPVDLKDAPWNPTVALTELRLAGQAAVPGKDSPLKQAITLSDTLSLAHIQNNFSLEFSALSYVNPLELRYRYKLDGLDQEWNEVAATQRVVTYTSLPAATYRFHVQAALERGAWSEREAALRIIILPAWWNSWWMRVFYGAAAVCLMACLYWYRIRQLEQQYDIRVEERLGERTRIARELHDTLLQGFHSVMLRFQVAIQSMPSSDRSRHGMEEALQHADLLIAEGRDRIRDLRHETGLSVPLSQALASVCEQFRPQPEVLCRVTVLGNPRDLHPGVRQEIYTIGKEAMINSFTHSGCSRVEVEINYEEGGICMRVCDDGQGIPLDMLTSGGKPNHWGIRGMRERAQKVGGHFKIRNQPGSGAEVELKLSARIAYTKGAEATFWSKLRTLTGRWKIERAGDD